MWILLVLTTTCSLVMTIKSPPRTVVEHIQYWNRLRKFASMIEKHNMSDYFNRPGITVFVPVSAAYSHFNEDAIKYGYDLTNTQTMENVLLYHVADGVTALAEMGNRSTSVTYHSRKKTLFFNSFTYGDTQVFTVNGAWIISGDIIASNGVVHIIDSFISPIQSDKTIAQYMEQPDLPNLAFHSIALASIVDPVLKLATNSSASVFTIFAPNDSYITTMPSYGQDILFNNTALLKTVFWAHIVEGEAMFIPRMGDLQELPAKAGVIRFYRVGSEVYISNNRVRARIIQSNIPVSNGVIHVIDDLLFYVYRNMRQKIQELPNITFINTTLTKTDQDLQDKFEDPSKKTFFLPSDEAFAKLPIDKQIQLENNETSLTRMFQDHMIIYGERDIESFEDTEIFATATGEILTIHKINNDIYVEGGGIKAMVTVPDIGCTNGVIHLVSNVLFQRDFTIWDAISGNSQLSEMKNFLSLHPDLQETLSSTAHGPMTVFLISDAAYNSIPQGTLNYLSLNAQKLLEAIQGSIANGVILSSTQISDEMDVPTISGHSITMYKTNQGIFIIGSRIRANVLIKDIWCSNGILHVTDNILHLPTRDIIAEMEIQPSLGVVSGIMELDDDLRRELSDPTRVFTMFVPRDDAFTYMPTHRAKVLSATPNLLVNTVKAHVIEGTQSYIESYSNYTSFLSKKGSSLFVLKTEDKAYAVSNNVKGMVVEKNIRCTNGMIHIVDTILDFPFWTVADIMEQRAELKPFYGLLQQVDEFYSWSSMHDVQQTVFVPSASFLASLSDYHSTYISTEPGMIRKIFEGHFLPDISLTQPYLDDMFRDSRVYLSESRYNITFTMMDRNTNKHQQLTSVDIGYNNLREMFDRVSDGIACSNGIIYIINGFLNYPLNDIANEIKIQPEISIGTDQLVKLIPSNSSINLQSKNTRFTMFAPYDDAFKYLSPDDIAYINANLSYTDRMQIIDRHIIKGQQMSYDAIMNGQFHAYYRNMTVMTKTDGLYLRWQNIEARIIRPNILATNGIIHVVDRFLLSTPYQTTTIPTTTRSTQKTVSSSQQVVTSIYVQIIAFVISLYCYKFWNRELVLS